MNPPKVTRDDTPPFLLHISFLTPRLPRHRPPPTPLSLTVHTWVDSTLSELSHHILTTLPPSSSVLPTPAIGTRLAFALAPTDRDDNGSPRPAPLKVMGTVLLGKGLLAKSSQGSGAGLGGGNPGQQQEEDGGDDGEPDDGEVALFATTLMPGDDVYCLVFPPDEVTGEVVSVASSTRVLREAMEEESRRRDGRGFAAAPTAPGGRYGEGFGRGPGRGWREDGPWSGGGGGGGGRFGRGRGEIGGSVRIPEGDWRRGDRLPDEGFGAGRRW
ncbi:hypothetical protein B0J18DRAFT_457063 [Chaetomium sp. MPI-SDFR-AT-0129]|nr:hypothetical protein B0J18DRAFT_457063 [Chaetomium sp. MPI-SDFR-AT-0129]